MASGNRQVVVYTGVARIVRHQSWAPTHHRLSVRVTARQKPLIESLRGHFKWTWALPFVARSWGDYPWLSFLILVLFCFLSKGCLPLCCRKLSECVKVYLPTYSKLHLVRTWIKDDLHDSLHKFTWSAQIVKLFLLGTYMIYQWYNNVCPHRIAPALLMTASRFMVVLWTRFNLKSI